MQFVAKAEISKWPLFGWRLDVGRIWRLVKTNVPLAGADIAEWGARRLDIFILGRFASAEVVGIYYVAQQIASCIDDIGVDAIKIGMLHDAGVIAAVAKALEGVVAPIVLDPVMIATSGAALIAPDAVMAMCELLA